MWAAGRYPIGTSDEGVSFGAPEKKLGIKGSPTRAVHLDNVRMPTGNRMIGDEGTGFATAMKTLDNTQVTIAAHAAGVALGAVDYALGYTPSGGSSSASRSRTSRVCSSCSPTWA